MDNVYLGIREQAFSIKPEDINIVLENDKQVFAAIADIPVRGNIVTLFCSFDGTVSLYYSNGKLSTGLGENPAIRKAAMSLLISSGQCLPFMELMKSSLLDESIMQVFLFYRDGIKSKKIDPDHAKTKEEKFLNFLIQNVLDEVRKETLAGS